LPQARILPSANQAFGHQRSGAPIAGASISGCFVLELCAVGEMRAIRLMWSSMAVEF